MDREFINALPSLPGVYLFKNESLEVIYIGKAKKLKNRLRSYRTNAKTDWKIRALIDEHARIDYVVTHSDIEASLLEAQLIGQHKPKYNVLLKSGQPFVYLLFTADDIPTIELVRNKKRKGTYFGPFLQRTQARSVYRFLIDTFKLFLCNKKIQNGCLDYHLGRCAGSCQSTFDPNDYIFRLDLAQQALKKNHAGFLQQLDTKINEYSAQQAYEKAQRLHGYRQDLEIIFATLHTRYSDDKYFPEVFTVTNPAPDITEQYTKTHTQLQKLLNTADTITTIDCFDISHFQSHHIVGSCIRYKSGMPEKNMFRKFKIKTLDNQNDYAALQEIVLRRYRDPKELPDIVLIDGGKGQRNAIKKVMPQAHVISLAKKEERLFSDEHPEGTVLDLQKPVGRLLIGLRDYAHHFAISYHRKRRHMHKK